ncbi:MAG: hypothetical protein WBP45_14930 [Daejeonella sp.]
MNLEEYLNQKAPKWLNIGEVILCESDYKVIGEVPGYKCVSIRGIDFNYILKADCEILYTMDELRYLRSLSIFKIPSKIINKNN